MRLRQIAFVAQDLDSVETNLGSELGAEVCFRDPGVGVFGLHNALFAVGDTFIEIVSPTQDGTTAGRYLERRGGDGGYMILLDLSADERAATRARAKEMGIREVFQAEDTHGGHHIVGTHFHPGDTGGAILSVDTVDPAGTWGWAGDSWASKVKTDRAGRLTAAEIQTDRVEELAARWGALLGIDPSNGVLKMEGSELRFVEPADDRGEGLASFEVLALDPALSRRSQVIAGVRIDWKG